MITDEASAIEWLRDLPEGTPETLQKLSDLVDLLKHENERQNLVSRASMSRVWQRHIADSAQLLRFVPRETSPWLDLGSGAGFPGVVVGVLRPSTKVTLVESRGKRVEWLQALTHRLGLSNVEVCGLSLDKLGTQPTSVVTARAFAPLDRLIELSARFSTAETLWVLPKGRSAQHEVDNLRGWRHMFHVEHSLTDPDAGIIVGSLCGNEV